MTHYLYHIHGPSCVYVGMTNDAQVRWRRHRYSAKRGHDTRLYRAMRKYGVKRTPEQCARIAAARWGKIQ